MAQDAQLKDIHVKIVRKRILSAELMALRVKQKDLDASSYVRKKSNEEFSKLSLKEMLETVAPSAVKRYEEDQVTKLEEEKRNAEERERKRQERLKRREQEKEARIKVEVIDFTPSEEPKAEPKPEPKPAPKKASTPRKPRGKSKKRFDADVISSVNWKKPNKK